jgi:hypothetical protein
MGVLAEQQGVLKDEAQHGPNSGHTKDRSKPDPGDESGIQNNKEKNVSLKHLLPLSLRENDSETGNVPEIIDTVDQGKKRDPGFPADVDHNLLEPPEVSGDKRRRGRVKILPSGPLVVERVDFLPAEERNHAEKRSQMSAYGVQALRPKERFVSALVKENKPLDEGGGQ